MNQGFYAYVDEDTPPQEHDQHEEMRHGTQLASQASIGKKQFYKNLQIIPKQNSNMTLTHQLSRATAGGLGLPGPNAGDLGGLQKTANMQSLKNVLFKSAGQE